MKRILPCSFFQAHARSLGLDSSHDLFPKKSSILSLKILFDSQCILAFVNTCLFCAWGLAVLDHLIWTSVEVPVSRWHRCSRTWWPCYCSHLTRCYLWRVPWPWNFYELWVKLSAGLTLYCVFQMKCLSFHVDRLAMLGVSPVCNSDWQSCYNETIASLIGVKQ